MVNKTQAKARPTRDTFAMKIELGHLNACVAVCFFVLLACACSPEVTVTSSSPAPFVSPRGVVNIIMNSLN